MSGYPKIAGLDTELPTKVELECTDGKMYEFETKELSYTDYWHRWYEAIMDANSVPRAIDLDKVREVFLPYVTDEVIECLEKLWEWVNKYGTEVSFGLNKYLFARVWSAQIKICLYRAHPEGDVDDLLTVWERWKNQ
jgi:hypothetical protein